MDEIFAYKPSEDDNYYLILGCDELSSTEQIIAEYKARVLDCHPDKHPGDSEAAKRFERIQTAKDVLCDPEKREFYDKWRHAGLSIPFQTWCNMKDKVHTSMHWAMPKKECMLEGNTETATSQSSSQFSDVDMNFINNATKCGSSSPQGVPWEREPASDILRKFRNYEI